MFRYLTLALVLSAAACAVNGQPEAQGDSQSNLTRIDGEARLSLLVEIRQGNQGVRAQVSVKCAGPTGRDDLAGEADEEGILFPLVRPEDCTIVATVQAGDAGKPATAIELKNPGKAKPETILNRSLDGYAVTATFSDPVP